MQAVQDLAPIVAEHRMIKVRYVYHVSPSCMNVK